MNVVPVVNIYRYNEGLLTLKRLTVTASLIKKFLTPKHWAIYSTPPPHERK